MFERFTNRAIDSIMEALSEACSLRHNIVGTEMILLGILTSKGLTQAALNGSGAYHKNAREQVKKILGYGEGSVAAEIRFTSRAKRASEKCLRRSR